MEEQMNPIQQPVEEKKSRWWLWLILALIIVGVGVWFWFSGGDLIREGSNIEFEGSNQDIQKDSFTEIETPYSSINSLAYIGGKLTYLAEKDGQKIIVFGDEIYGEQYDEVAFLTDVDGKIAYTAIEIGQESNKYFVVYDGQEYGREYGHASAPFSIDGKLGYKASKDEEKFIVFDGIEYGKEDKIPQELFNNNFVLKYFNGEIWFNGEKIATGTGTYVQIINGKLVIYDEKNEVLMYGNEEIGSNYDGILYPTEIKGKLGYGAKLNGKQIFIYDGEQLGGEYDRVTYGIGTIRGEPKFEATRGDETFIYFNGDEFGNEYDIIYTAPLTNVGNKVLYFVQEGEKGFYVYGNDEIGKDYESVAFGTDLNGKLAYVGSKGEKIFSYIIIEN